MAKGIHDLGNGLGFVYVTDSDGSRIYESVPNSKSGARKVKGLASSVSSTALNKRGIGTIVVNTITGTGSITSITVDGVNQISSSISYTGSTTTAQLHSLIEAAINSYTPGSSPNMTASFVGSKVNLITPVDLGSSLNGYSITISSTGNATFTTTLIVGGTDNIESYDKNFGFRFYIDADYGVSDISGSGSAVYGDKSNAEEITDFIIPRSLNSAVASIDTNISAGAVTFERKSSQSFITVANEGFATTDDLNYIGIDNFADGDLITVKSKFNVTGVYTNITESGNIRKAVGSPDIKLGNDTPNAATSVVTFQLKAGFWYETNRAQSLSIGDLVDIDITTVAPTAGDSLVYNAGTGKFEPDTIGGGGGGSINSLSDVDTSTNPPTELDVLQWDGVNWVPAAAGGGGGGANLSITGNTTSQLVIASDSGTDATLTSATDTLAGLMSSGDKIKLDFVTVTGATDLDELTEDIADFITLSGVAANAENLGTFTGSVIPDNQTIKAAIQAIETHIQTGISIFDLTNVSGAVATNDLLVWDGTDFTTLSKAEASITGFSTLTNGYIPYANSTSTITDSLLKVTESGLSLNTSAVTYSFTFNGDLSRSIGLARHTTSDTAGNTLSVYAGGATVGASNKNGGNYDIYTGIATGTGSSQFNIYTVSAGASGTTDRNPSLKLNINGDGRLELTTSTANSKMRIGHNLKTILSLSTGIGIDFSRVADGSYTISGGIHMVDSAIHRMLISSANAGVGFVRNPASDTAPVVVIGGSSDNSGANIWCGVGSSGLYNFHFKRTWVNAGSSISSYFDTTGTNTNVGQVVVGQYINNSVINSSTGSNYGLQINASGHTVTNQNIALQLVSGGLLIGAGTTTNYHLTFGAGANRTIGVARESSSTEGRSLTISSGSAALAGTNLNAGNVTISTGISTGTGSADIIFQTATAGSSGNSDNTPTTKMTIKGSGVINLASLPTSSTGLSAGDIWNNGNVIHIV